MSHAEEQLLLDAANLSILLMGIGLLAGVILRRHPGLLPSGNRPGRVSVDAFGRPELGMAVVLIFIFYLVVRHPAQLRFLTPSLYLAVMLATYFAARNIDFARVFGFVDLRPARLSRQTAIALVVITGITLLVHQGWVAWLTDLVGQPDVQDKVRELRENRDPGSRASIIFSACVLAPVSEEFVFRGFLYPALKRFTRPLIAATVVGAIFAAIHLSLIALLPLFVLALLLTLAYEWTGSLLVPILVHAGFNLTNIMIMFLAPHGG